MKILITGGPTRDPIDAVRYISNRSSGKLSAAIARTAVAAGHETTLLLGPVCDAGVESLAGHGVRVHRFETSAELESLLDTHWPDHDVLIMAAAVADFRPANVVEGKLPRGGDGVTIRFEPTPDLVAKMAATKRPDQRVIAFALEDATNLEQRALEKLIRKGVDAIVANPLGTMEADSITATWFTSAGRRESLEPMSKEDFARWLIGELEHFLIETNPD